MQQMKKSTPLFSLIVPFFNERKIVDNYIILNNFLKKHIPNYQLVLVDDGSSEYIGRRLKTKVKSNKRVQVIRYYPNRGRGYAVTEGLKRASGDYVAYIDADLDIDPKHLITLIVSLKSHPVVIGSKVHPSSEVKTRLIRKIASPILNSFIRIGLGSKVRDHHVGIKGFHRCVITSVLPALRERRWTFDAELLIAIQNAGYPIYEMPVTMTYGMTHIKFSYVYYFWDVTKFIMVRRFSNMSGFFRKLAES